MTITLADHSEALVSNSLAMLRLLDAPGIPQSLIRKIVEAPIANGRELYELIEDARFSSQFLNDAQRTSLDVRSRDVTAQWMVLRDAGIYPLDIMHPLYPRRIPRLLGAAAPLLLMAKGNLDLLGAPGVGFCGSRKASDRGLETAQDCADQLAGMGINVVSGYAAGVDTTVHSTALAKGGTTTVVLAEGIMRFAIKRALRPAWSWDRAVVVSQYLPHAAWSVRSAMQRNRTIVGLADAMVLVEASSKGGSIEAGRAALASGQSLFAPVYDGMPETATGNRELLSHGALPLMRSRTSGRARLGTLVEAVTRSAEARLPRDSGEPLGPERENQLDLWH